MRGWSGSCGTWEAWGRAIALVASALVCAAAPVGAQPMSERGERGEQGEQEQREEASETPAAREASSRSASRDASRDGPGPFSVRTGLGFSVDPDSFVLGFEGDYAFSRHVSAGVLLELGLDDDLIFVSPVAYGRYRFDLADFTDEESVHALFPYLQGGLGLTHWDDDDRLGDDDDTEFLLNVGFGVEYEVAEDVSVVSQMLFNIIPDKIFGERFYYSWEVLSVRYRF